MLKRSWQILEFLTPGSDTGFILNITLCPVFLNKFCRCSLFQQFLESPSLDNSCGSRE